MACDGLWDVMDNDEAIRKIIEIFGNGGSIMSKVAEDMLDFALGKGTDITEFSCHLNTKLTITLRTPVHSAGSKDNISAVIIQLPGAKISHQSQPRSTSNTSTETENRQWTDDDDNTASMCSPPDRGL